jgi:hypothetical protein
MAIAAVTTLVLRKNLLLESSISRLAAIDGAIEAGSEPS